MFWCLIERTYRSNIDIERRDTAGHLNCVLRNPLVIIGATLIIGATQNPINVSSASMSGSCSSGTNQIKGGQPLICANGTLIHFQHSICSAARYALLDNAWYFPLFPIDGWHFSLSTILRGWDYSDVLSRPSATYRMPR